MEGRDTSTPGTNGSKAVSGHPELLNDGKGIKCNI